MKKILYILFSLILLLLGFFYWLIYIEGELTFQQFMDLHEYGQVRPTKFVGMTREEVFKWAMENRVTVSDIESIKNKISISWTDNPIFFETPKEFEEYRDRDDPNLNPFLTTDTISVNVFAVYGAFYWDLLILKNNIVVEQKASGYNDDMSIAPLISASVDDYYKKFNKDTK